MTVTHEMRLQALQHEDPIVRNRMLEFFAEQRNPDPEITRRVKAVIKQLGWGEAYWKGAPFVGLPLDEETVLWMIEALANDQAEEIQDETKDGLMRWFCGGPVHLLEKYKDEVSKIPLVDADSRHAEMMAVSWEWALQRMEIASASVEANWERLDGVMEKAEKAESYPFKELSEAEAICDHLAKVDGSIAETATKWLALDSDSGESVHEIKLGLGIFLSGALALEENIPRILELFEEDADWWNEMIERAIPAMKSQKALSAVLEQYHEQDWHGRLYLAGAIRQLPFPELDEKVVEILELEEDLAIRAQLGKALVDFGTPLALEKAREVYAEAPDDPNNVDIGEDLYPIYRILGIDDPEMDSWKEGIESFREYIDNFDPTEDNFDFDALDPDWIPSDMDDPLPFADPWADVGRNDPCPCGSGKKYKKCCLPKN